MKLYQTGLLLLSILLITVGLSACDDKTVTPGGKGTFQVESSYIKEISDHLEINAEYPVMKGFTSAEGLNSEIKEKLDAAVKEVEDAAKELESREGFSAFLNSHYQYFHNNDLVSLWINYDNYLGGAHGMYWVDSYTFNTNSGEVYLFPDLFTEQEGVDFVTEKILQQTQGENSIYFDTARETILGYDGNYNFIINGDSIIVYFPLYDIAPYVAGIRSFVFPKDELQGILKPEIADAMTGEPEEMPPFLSN